MLESPGVLIPLLIHIATWCLLGIWILLDPFFYLAVDMLLIDLRLRPQGPFGGGVFHSFRRVGWRILLLPCLSLVAIGSAAYLLIFQLTHGADPLGHIFPYWIVIAFGWTILLTFQSTWHRYGMPIRIRFVLRTAQQLATQLNDCWPQESGYLPWIGQFRIDPKIPDMLIVSNAHSRLPLWEPCGIFVRHDPSGIVRFDLASRPDIYLSLEVFFNEETPHSYVDVFEGFNIQRDLQGSVQLHNDTFLVWYESDFADMTDQGAETLSDVVRELGAEMAKHGNGPSSLPP